MLDTPELTVTSPQPAAVIHLTIPRPEIGSVMGPGITEVMTVVASQGIAPAGPWYSHHLKMDPEIFDFEIGLPVNEPVTASGRVTQGELPGARVVRTVYQGPYEGLGAAWGEFDAWIREQGLTPVGDLWERYLVGPESGSDPSMYRTELNRPIA
jgi:effector-binding domain-containing protein